MLRSCQHEREKMREPCLDPSWLCWIETHPALAGWFQAVGSIAAIVVALLVPYVQHEVQRRRELRRTAHAIVHLAHQAGAILGQLTKIAAAPASVLGRNRLEAFPEEMLDAVIADLDRLPVQQFDDYDALATVTALRGQMQRARGTLTTALSAEDIDGWEAVFRSQKERADDQIRTLVSRFSPHSELRTTSLKSLPAQLCAAWSTLPLPWRRQNAPTKGRP